MSEVWFIPLIQRYAVMSISKAAQFELKWHSNILDAQDPNIVYHIEELKDYIAGLVKIKTTLKKFQN